MELQWRKLDRHIELQPMPTQFARTKAWVVCNDCGGKSLVKYHWLGNKCGTCESYNTNEIKLVNNPADEEADRAHEDDTTNAARVAGESPQAQHDAPAAGSTAVDTDMTDAPWTGPLGTAPANRNPITDPPAAMTAEDDDLNFWGDPPPAIRALSPARLALSPSRWGLPLSPPASWTRSPRWRHSGDDNEGDEEMSEEDEEEDDEEEDEEAELEDAEEEGEGDGMELFGHR